MKLFIKKLILWSTNPGNAPRVIEFATDKINVLTGESGTGKSTISDIIDYCLGSDKCAIPVGMIRDMCAWYGLLLEVEEGEVLLARRGPGTLQATGDMFLAEGSDLSIPPVILEHNINVEAVKEKFNRWGGIPKLSVEEVMGDGANKDYPSFRDMAAFNFQPQHIVANPYTLFFKTDTTQHREKLRVIFPFVLGSITTDILLKQRELNELKRQYRQLKADFDMRRRAAERWLGEIESYYIQARRYGLLPNGTDDRTEWPPERYLVELRAVSKSLEHDRGPKSEPGLNERYVEELQSVMAQENVLAGKVGDLTRRLAKMQAFETAFDEYQKTAAENKDRLASVGWLGRQIAHLKTCPFCASTWSEQPAAWKKLDETVAQFEELSRKIQVSPSRLDVEKHNLRHSLREMEAQLKAIRDKRLAIEDRNREQAEKRQTLSQIYYFAGQLAQALDNYTESGNSELRKKLDECMLRITFLAPYVDQAEINKRSDAALEAIARLMTFYATGLQLEHRAENVALDTKELTVKFNGLKGRTDFLWEVGSGQNWVGYHLAALFAMHEFLIGRTDSPVPSFLVIDQPSQVYFPESSWHSSDKKPLYSVSSDISEDIKGVQRIFGQLKAFFDRTEGKVQIIVTEHAGEITWDAVKDSINIVGNWRGEKEDYLIPKSWLSDETTLVKRS